MPFLRSLSSAVSGMRNNALSLDVISNNIANINTVGYKSQRMTFSEAFAQTLRYATGPSNGQGGVNSIQVGLGSSNGSMDTLFTQGTVSSTGNYSDLAISGDGFFVVKKSDKTFYSRAGQFVADANGYLVNSSTGAYLQGYKAVNGITNKSVSTENLQIPLSDKYAAKETSKITYVGNLSSTAKSGAFTGGVSYALGNVSSYDIRNLLYENPTGKFNTDLPTLTANTDTVTVDDGTNKQTFTYVSGQPTAGSKQFNTLEQLFSEIKLAFGSSFNYTYQDPTATTPGNGSYTIESLNSATLTFGSSSAPLLNALNLSTGGTLSGQVSTGIFYRPAIKDDAISTLRDSTGNLINENASSITNTYQLSWKENGVEKSASFTGITKLSDLLDKIKTNFPNAQNVSLDPVSGKLNIVPSTSSSVEITDLSLTSYDNTTPPATEILGFNNVYKSFTAPEGTAVTSNVSVYDSQGNTHLVQLIFNKTSDNTWSWSALTDETTTTGKTTTTSKTEVGSGSIFFNSDGSFQSASSTTIKIPTTNGTNPSINISLDFGTSNSFLGMTQVSNTTTITNQQDGYTAGDLESVSIDKQGKLVGTYSNGQFKTLGQIALAKFRNNGGLDKVGDSLYTNTINSGDPMVSTLEEGSLTEIVAGSLEASTVDLTEEFAKMITTQRGYSANAKIITTSDEMLQEMIALKR
jgi:flagellar hook protein FlgE